MNIRISAALFLASFFLTSRMHSLPALYITYGVLGGSASGFTYNSVLNAVPRWFPDRPGLISGVLLMGFGASSMVIGALYTAVTPAGFGAWRHTLALFGVAMAAILLGASFYLRPPRPEEITAGAAGRSSAARSRMPGEMMRHPPFWFFFLWAILTTAVGLIVISQARSLARAAAPAISPGTLSLAVGLISVCNGLGRILFGGLFDKIKEKTLWLVALCDLLGVGALALAMRGSLALLVAGFMIVGLGYGGTPPMNAAVVKDFYGLDHYPVNFSIINMNMLPASFASTVSGMMYDASGGFRGILLLLTGILAAALAVTAFVRRPPP